MKSEKLRPNPATTVRYGMFNKHHSGCKHQGSLRFIRLSCIVIFIACLFAFPVGAKTKNEKQLSTESTNKISEKLHLAASESSTAKETNSSLIRQLQQARISVYQVGEDSKGKNELKQAIEQIRSISLKPHKQPTKSAAVTKPAPMIEPNEASSDTKTHEEPEKTPIQPEPENVIKPECQYELVSEYALQMLENLIQKPDQLKNPFELAEVLFLSGHAEKATMFYQEALKRKDPDDLGSAQQKAWILFQIGNCLRNDDLQSAQNIYRQLIAEYPDYLFTDLAKVQEKLIDWYLKDKPDTLIKECKQLTDGM